MRFSTVLLAAPFLSVAFAAPTHNTTPELAPGQVSVGANTGKTVSSTVQQIARQDAGEADAEGGNEDMLILTGADSFDDSEEMKRALDILQGGQDKGSELRAQIAAIVGPLGHDTPVAHLETGIDMVVAALQSKCDKLQSENGQIPVQPTEQTAVDKEKGAEDAALILASIQAAVGRLSPEQKENPDVYKRLCALDVVLDQYLHILDGKSTGLLAVVAPKLCSLRVTLQPVLDKVSCIFTPLMDGCAADGIEATKSTQIAAVENVQIDQILGGAAPHLLGATA